MDQRLSPGIGPLRKSAWAGLTDSVPRAALLAIHARVEGTESDCWDDPSLVQVWGPRFSAYVVAEPDRAVFTVGRHPDDERKRERSEGLAARLVELLGDRTMTYRAAGRALGVNHNMLRYASTTGMFSIRWEGSGQPTIRAVPRPDIEPAEARLELARRFLHMLGPVTSTAFGNWAGMTSRRAVDIFDDLRSELVPVVTPIGEAWILASDEVAFERPAEPVAPARLLPSGDIYYLLWGDDRELLVPDSAERSALWTSRVWPGAVMVRGDIVGTWRRSKEKVTVEAWRRLSGPEREAIEAEATSLPIPDLERPISLTWAD